MSERGRPIVEVLLEGVPVACARVETWDARTSPIARCELELDRDQPYRVTFRPGSPVVVSMGDANNGVVEVFRGTVHMASPEQTVLVTALDRMRDLRDLRVTRAFSQVTAQEALRWALDHHQVAHRLADVETGRRRWFILANDSLLSALRMARQTWGLDDWDMWAAVDGEVWFGPWASTSRAQADSVAELVEGRNLLGLTPSTGTTGLAETWLAPEIVHSRTVWIEDLRYWRAAVRARVERVHHLFKAEKERTWLEWTAIPAS